MRIGRWIGKFRVVLRDVLAVFLAWRDPAAPFSAKAITIASLVYVVIPFDLIPDVIPIIGWLDDLAAVPLATYFAGRLIPRDILAGLRHNADMVLMRLGPKFLYITAGILAAWLLLGGLSLVLMWRGTADASPTERRGSALPAHIKGAL